VHSISVRLDVDFKVRDLERTHGLDREIEYVGGRCSSSRMLNLAAYGSQSTKHLRSVKSLPFTVITKAHERVRISTGGMRRKQRNDKRSRRTGFAQALLAMAESLLLTTRRKAFYKWSEKDMIALLTQNGVMPPMSRNARHG